MDYVGTTFGRPESLCGALSNHFISFHIVWSM